MKICFDLEEFKDWLEIIDVSNEYDDYHIIKGSNVFNIWESNINGVVTKHKELELRGEIREEVNNIEMKKLWNEIIGKDEESKC